METKLRRYLDDRGIKHSFIAGKLGISRAMFSLYICGLRIPPAILAQLSDILNCDPSELYGYIDEEVEA